MEKKYFDLNFSKEELLFLSKRAPIRSFPENKADGIKLHVKNNHVYIEKGEGEIIVFLHGLLGSIYNYIDVFQYYSKKYRVVMPYLPMYDSPLNECSVKSLGDYLETFVKDILNNQKIILVGTSTGAGASIYYSVKPNNSVKALVLCGSVGLGHTPLTVGKGIPRNNFDYIQYYARSLFFDTSIPPHEMMLDVFNAVQDNEIVLRIIRLAKTAIKITESEIIQSIKKPTLLIWGESDNITPLYTAEKFNNLIENSVLRIIPNCGHVVSQEKPFVFIDYLNDFLKQENLFPDE